MKATLSLGRRRVDFLEAEAQRRNRSYRTMIRLPVDPCAIRCSAVSRPGG